MRKLFNRLFGRNKKHVPKHIIRLSASEYDELIDSKLDKLRSFINQNMFSRDDEKLFNKQFQEAFLLYEQAIKSNVSKSSTEFKDTVTISPFGSLKNVMEEIYRTKKTKIPWYKKKLKPIKFIGRTLKKFKFKIQVCWQHILLMREIRKMKRLFPDMKLSNQRALNLVNAAKLNKRVQELYPR